MGFRFGFHLPYPPGLKINAILISISLFTLTAILGFRAHSIARVHLSESKALMERDVPLQNLLFQLDSSLTAREQARKKWEITRDPVYGKLVMKYRNLAAETLTEVNELRPGFLPPTRPKATVAEQKQQLQRAEETLNAEREQNVRHARDVAAGLVRLILFAVILSLVITAWLTLLLYHGLVSPLRHLRVATTRIREGDLSCRMEEKGVTELREIAQDFNSMAVRLESLDQAKNEFLATISHEIRNPMTALKEGLNLLAPVLSEERRLSLESQRKCLSACLIASKRLEFMINNMLNLSKTGSAVLERDFSKKNVCAAVQTAIDEVRPLAEKKSIAIRYSSPESIILLFHWNGMVQALVNLLLNAIKYGAEASVIDVIVAVYKGEPEARMPAQVRIEVVNSGTDISAEELPRIFDRFYRGANSVKLQGMGIGLHVVKQVVEAHHGVVSARSAAGKTRMMLLLPSEPKVTPVADWVGGPAIRNMRET